MPRSKNVENDGISEKLKFLGLDLDKIPESLKKYRSLEYRPPRFYDEKQYKQYRYVNVNDIDILLTPSNRLDDLNEKYKKASPLFEYLDSENEENIMKYTTFLSMLKNISIEDIEKVEAEQEKLSETIPFKVKFEGNYLWQIYYSENTDRYFMLVPTQDTDYSAFFYLLKKKIEGKKDSVIYVPISGVRYSNQYLKNSEFEDLENYMWLFTKDWPLIYEVYDKKGNLSIQIIGETNVYEKIRSLYKVKLETKSQSTQFYRLTKALFIMQTELPEFYNFETRISEDGSLELYLNDEKIQYQYMVEFIRNQYKEGLKRRRELKKQIRLSKKRLAELQELVASQEVEYLAKEKQISTFLECKKSFFGKFKYFFKYSKKSKKTTENNEEEKTENVSSESATIVNKEKKKIPIKKVYTLEELITSYKELRELEETLKNLLMDINALKLKTKNLAKKIENATNYINEIDSHKKSIFEFWKYSNKDEVSVLPEGEQEEVNIIRKIEKTFNYEDDFEEFGRKLDRMQRKMLSDDELDSTYILTTSSLEALNKVKKGGIKPEDLEKDLKLIKRELKEVKSLDDEEFDIFGTEDTTKIRKIGNKRHRELPRDKFDILNINNRTDLTKFKVELQNVAKNITNAVQKIVIPETLPLYFATDNKKLNPKIFNVFNINAENEILNAENSFGNIINLYKIKVNEGTNGIGLTNIVYFNNKNRTLPVGMDLSTKVLIDISNVELKVLNKKTFRICKMDEYDDFADIDVKKVNLIELSL